MFRAKLMKELAAKDALQKWHKGAIKVLGVSCAVRLAYGLGMVCLCVGLAY